MKLLKGDFYIFQNGGLLMDEFFTAKETFGKINKPVRTKNPINGIPATIGTVTAASWVDFSADKFMLEVKWRVSREPTVSCLFTKTGYENLLEEIRNARSCFYARLFCEILSSQINL